MPVRPYSLVFVLALLALPALSRELPCRDADRECAAQALQGHAVKRLGYWKRVLGEPLERRVEAAPPELLEYIGLDNIQSGFPNKPRAPLLEENFLRDVHAAFAEIPPAIRRRLLDKLAGIYFVEDLGGTGYTDYVFDDRANAVAGFVILDRSVLAARTANAWATWKENTPFKPVPGYALSVRIERPEHDNRRNAIQYILLHELGHVLSIGERIHPRWDVPPKEHPRDQALYPFFRLSWRIAVEENRYATIYDRAFPMRQDVVYYREPRLAADRMADAYRSLQRTSFVTLYAATHPADDFAEAFATYVHTVLMKKPFEIRLHREGKVEKVYRACWAEERCAEKRRMLERFLAVTP